MSRINIRKPAFMRDEQLMEAYLTMAGDAMEKASDSKLTMEQRYTNIRRAKELLDKAAEAGGFLRTLDLVRYCDDRK